VISIKQLFFPNTTQHSSFLRQRNKSTFQQVVKLISMRLRRGEVETRTDFEDIALCLKWDYCKSNEKTR